MERQTRKEMIEYYRAQGAPEDQQVLVDLLRAAQEMDGGAILQQTIAEIAEQLQMREAIMQALIRRIPSLRSADAPHRLEICGTCRGSITLAQYIEGKYGVKNGRISEKGRFSYYVTGCMKNCRQGPSIRWDGELYSRADRELIDQLIAGKGPGQTKL